MKNQWGKIVFIVVLIVCFAAMFLLCGSQETVDEMFDYSHYALDNETLSIELTGGSYLRVSGEGKLSGVDMRHMLEDNEIKASDLTNIDIEDGIDEIGYLAFNGCKYLESLRLGKDVRLIHNGAVKSCTKLLYVFMEKGVEQVGSDFLFNCGNVYVVTSAKAEELPEMTCVPEDHRLTEVNSYQDFIEKRNAIKLLSYGPKQLRVNGKKYKKSKLNLPKGKSVNSVGMKLEPGTYLIRLLGGGLAGVSEADISIEVGEETLTPDSVVVEDEAITCKFNLSQTPDAVVFRLTNRTEGKLAIEELCVHDLSYAIPAGVLTWWQ